MGNCTSTMTIAPDVVLTLKAHPDINHLLALQLHYDCYDKQSKKLIDECTQLALTNNLNIELAQLEAKHEQP